jgi:acetylglutamate synthase
VRARGLFESAFGRPLRAGFFGEPVDRLYLEENYRGIAVIRQTPVGPYLTKFAVDRQAQGEGIGTELWAVLTRDYPAFFWRSRAANPITPWYVKQCEGMVRLPTGTSSGAGCPSRRSSPPSSTPSRPPST